MIILMRVFSESDYERTASIFPNLSDPPSFSFFFTGSKEAQVELRCLRSAERSLMKTPYLAVNMGWVPIKHPKNLQNCHGKESYSENISLYIEKER
jgi:hypothetical protein